MDSDVKNKGGDTTDMDNSRAIAISNVDTKILEKLILFFFQTTAQLQYVEDSEPVTRST